MPAGGGGVLRVVIFCSKKDLKLSKTNQNDLKQPHLNISKMIRRRLKKTDSSLPFQMEEIIFFFHILLNSTILWKCMETIDWKRDLKKKCWISLLRTSFVECCLKLGLLNCWQFVLNQLILQICKSGSTQAMFNSEQPKVIIDWQKCHVQV